MKEIQAISQVTGMTPEERQKRWEEIDRELEEFWAGKLCKNQANGAANLWRSKSVWSTGRRSSIVGSKAMTPDEAEHWLRLHFEAGLAGKVERYLNSRVHAPIPSQFFSAASSECREHFVDGNFYGCITLAQSVAEGLSRFLAEKKGVPVKKDFAVRVHRLEQARIIKPGTEKAFLAIHGEDRNDFHHLNKNIEQHYRILEQRAAAIVEALYQIESDVFGYTYNQGAINPTYPEYWPSNEPGTVQAWMRSQLGNCRAVAVQPSATD